jgi:hypothetical protein
MSNSGYYSWNDLSIEIQNRMLECQEEQGNPRNPEIFKKKIDSDKNQGAFDWEDTKEGFNYWRDGFLRKNLTFIKDLSDKIKETIQKLENYELG